MRHPGSTTSALIALSLLGHGAGAQPAGRTSHEVRVGSSTIDVAIDGTPGSEKVLLDWVDASARGVANYLGRFPVPRVRLSVRVANGQRIGHGVTYGGRVPSIRIQVGRDADAAAFADDWVLTHEMLHLGFPDLTTDDSWAEEGLSTYAEPLARLRAGTAGPEKIWMDLIQGLPQGLPGPGDRGLHGTEAWGRTYWGGAGFWLMADIRIREQTKNGKGLPDALAGILAAGGDIRSGWTLARTLEVGDRAIGRTVLADLYAEQAARPHAMDLNALWTRLGVRREGGRLVYDDRAPLAAVRRAITEDSPQRTRSAQRATGH
jgi:hypothetical protein